MNKNSLGTFEDVLKDDTMKQLEPKQKYPTRRKNTNQLVFYRIVNVKTWKASTGGQKPLFVKTNGKFYQKKQLEQYLRSPGIMEMYQSMDCYKDLRIRKYIVNQAYNIREVNLIEEFIEVNE